jgi:hypothetical protein
MAVSFMARIVIAWELGGGLGHLVPLVPIVEQLVKGGHQIFLVVRDLSRVEGILRGPAVKCLQAPVKLTKPKSPILETRSFAHILHDNGYEELDELRGMANGWKHLFELIQPHLILCDHAPTALLAARTCQAKRAIIGTGFCCPPDEAPFPDLRPWLPIESNQLVLDEAILLDRVNEVLCSWGLPGLERLSQLYGDVNDVFLTTFPELDHYPGRFGKTVDDVPGRERDRDGGEYFGTWLTPGGKSPAWPTGNGHRVFAYLKSFDSLPKLLEVMRDAKTPTLIYMDGYDETLRAKFENDQVRFVTDRLDLSAVAKTCDLAVLNGGHNSTCTMLLAGKPIMTIPLNLEQAYNGSSVAKMGAGFGVFPENPELFSETWTRMRDSTMYAQGARAFSHRYANWRMDESIDRISRRLIHLAVHSTNRWHLRAEA